MIARKHLGQLRAAEKSLKSQEREKVKTTGKAWRRNHQDLGAIFVPTAVFHVSIAKACAHSMPAFLVHWLVEAAHNSSCSLGTHLALVYRLATQVRSESNKLNQILDRLI